jgi:hypothetical protein
MKKLLVILYLVGAASSAHGVVDLKEWKWQRPIDTQTSSGFVRLSLPSEVFDESQGTLNDLRVVDESHALVPHVIHWGRLQGTQRTEWPSARLLNATFVPGKYAAVTADFGETEEKNQIAVGLSGRNFRRRALLEGSRDSRSWERVAEDAWLFDVSLPGQTFKVDTISFPANTFRYLRLTVYNMADDPRRIAIEAVKGAFLRSETEKELTPVAVRNRTESHDEKKRQTIVDFDLGFRNLPVARLQFEIGTPYFHRGFELLGRNELKEKVPRKTETGWDPSEREAPWRPVCRGVLYRIQDRGKVSEFVKVEGETLPYRYVQLRIYNGDNPPLKLDGVSVYRRDTSLVFQARQGGSYRLVGGNPGAREADYDLSKSVQGIDAFTLPVVGLGAPAAIPQKEKVLPWTERHGTLLWIILFLAVGTMLTLIVRSLKKHPPSRGPDNPNGKTG